MVAKKLFDKLACLKDIEQSIIEINEFLPEERDFFAFQKDIKTRKAIERNIEIIGEAMDRLLKAFPAIGITDSRSRRFVIGVLLVRANYFSGCTTWSCTTTVR